MCRSHFLLASALLLLLVHSGHRRISSAVDFSGTTGNSSSTDTSAATPRNYTEFLHLRDNAVTDVAYFLRAHKFNEFDRRYDPLGNSTEKGFFHRFPNPPLRSFHWEVQKYCQPSFISCLRYLNRKISKTFLKRNDDTTTALINQKLNLSKVQIGKIDKECRNLLKIENVKADPFEGPIERFQWRTTASYYMCWYTMLQEPSLASFKESCDNFANCLDPQFGVHNLDPRANDNVPFSCALYSFCPDPCCPQKHIATKAECWERKQNPCFAENNFGKRQCSSNPSENTDVTSMVLNRWNVSCNCPEQGTKWDSSFGICVDINECVEGTHNCRIAKEFCLNLPNSFTCACSWGHVWNENSSSCTLIESLNLNRPSENVTEKSNRTFLQALFSSRSDANIFLSNCVLKTIFLTFLTVLLID